MECDEVAQACETATVCRDAAECLLAGRGGFVFITLMKISGLALDIVSLTATWDAATEYWARSIKDPYWSERENFDDAKEDYYWDISFLTFSYIVFQRLLLVGYITYKLCLASYICTCGRCIFEKNNHQRSDDIELGTQNKTSANGNDDNLEKPAITPANSNNVGRSGDADIAMDDYDIQAAKILHELDRPDAGKNGLTQVTGDLDKYGVFSLGFNTYYGSIWNTTDWISKVYTYAGETCDCKSIVYLTLYAVLLFIDWFFWIAIVSVTYAAADENAISTQTGLISLWVASSGYASYWQHCILFLIFPTKSDACDTNPCCSLLAKLLCCSVLCFSCLIFLVLIVALF